MFAWKNADWNQSETDSRATPLLEAGQTGMIAGTKVATNMGWRAVEAICEGDRVLTFDGGLQTVVAVTRHYLMAEAAAPGVWPMHVPAGVLGNREAMQILPDQAIMIESDTAEDMFGDPFALIPGAALDGFNGISQARPEAWIEVIELHFARDEIVFANIGALFLSRAKADLLSDAVAADYTVLSLDQADMLVEFLEAEMGSRSAQATGVQSYAAA